MNERRAGFVVLAGPQCAGKSTAKNYLYARYMTRESRSQFPRKTPPRNLRLLQEMRQLVMHERGIHSAIFIDSETEQEIIARDLARLRTTLCTNRESTFLDETSVFTLAHARRQGLPIDESFARYREHLASLDAVMLFLDVPPTVSWARRKARYQERIVGFPLDEAAVVLSLYREYLDAVYAETLDLMNRIDLPTYRIDASGPMEDTLSACAQAFVNFAGEQHIELCPRF
jgi:thymidylate kinase